MPLISFLIWRKTLSACLATFSEAESSCVVAPVCEIRLIERWWFSSRSPSFSFPELGAVHGCPRACAGAVDGRASDFVFFGLDLDRERDLETWREGTPRASRSSWRARLTGSTCAQTRSAPDDTPTVQLKREVLTRQAARTDWKVSPESIESEGEIARLLQPWRRGRTL